MNEVFGIDLGTTYSAIARVNEYGQAEVIRNAAGNIMTPSVVYFESGTGNTIVGEEAKNSVIAEPDRVVTVIKRHMGEAYPLDFDGKGFTPESISGMILRALVDFAQEQTEIDSNRAVITVPAYFGVQEKEATRQAGEIAGLDVVQIITEPVAAALSYGVNIKDERKTVFVYDLGGGTFDTTILKISPDALEVVAIDGNRVLGGVDWDNRLAELVNEKFVAETGIEDDPMDDDEFVADLMQSVEKVKIALSQKETATANLRLGAAKAKIAVTREEFESVTRNLLDQTIEIAQRTLEAGQSKEPGLVIDEYLLVGGSSMMPAVATAVQAAFGQEPKLMDPNLAVAKGAAIFSTLGEVPDLTGGEAPTGAGTPDAGDAGATGGDTGTAGGNISVPGRVVTNVLPKGLGIRVWDEPSQSNRVAFLTHKNDQLPIVDRMVEFSCAQDNTRDLPISLWEQNGDEESPDLDNNKEVTPDGALFTGLPNLSKGSPIQVLVNVSEQGLVTLAVSDPQSKKVLELGLTMSVLQQEDVDKAREMVSRISVSM
ncbi:hypothetical protein BFG51_04140 [Dietzia alimentaria]|nr:hypothetical protein BFG51_04140 [Dietzia alimentaria]